MKEDELRPDPKGLPKDVEYHGKRSIYIQDLKFILNRYGTLIKHRFFSLLTGKTYEGELLLPNIEGVNLGLGYGHW